MAFQTGSQVRPELGRADLSGFARSGESIGAALANLGATIGSAIQVAGEKKKEKALSKQAQEMVFGFLKSNPEQATLFGLPEDFEMSDVKPVVDVLGSKPSISLMMQLKMAEMEANRTERPTIGDITKLKEFLPGDKIIKDGRIVDTTLRDEVLPVTDDLVQQLLQTDVGRSQLYGYAPAELISTTTEDEEAE
jgi:hypothetical protein